jgi:hypothetical protein
MEDAMAGFGFLEMSGDRSPRLLLRDAIRAQPPAFDRRLLFSWFDRYAPGVDRLAIEGYLEAGTVNEPNRRHYPEPEDLVCRLPDGSYERYELGRHGRWSKLGEPVRSDIRPFQPAA